MKLKGLDTIVLLLKVSFFVMFICPVFYSALYHKVQTLSWVKCSTTISFARCAKKEFDWIFISNTHMWYMNSCGNKKRKEIWLPDDWSKTPCFIRVYFNHRKRLVYCFSACRICCVKQMRTPNSVLASFKKRQGALSPSPSRAQAPVPPRAATQA